MPRQRIEQRKGRRYQSNQNNSVVQSRNKTIIVPDGVFPSAEAVINKKVRKLSTTQKDSAKLSGPQGGEIQRQLIQQFDDIDCEFDQGVFVNEDLVQVSVDVGEDEQFPEDPDTTRDSDSEADLNEEIEQIVEIPFDQQSKAESEVILRNTVEDFESLRGVPAFEKFLQKTMAKERNLSQTATTAIPQKEVDGVRYSHKTREKSSFADNKQTGTNLLKSPSDTTIYALAFNQKMVSPSAALMNGANPIASALTKDSRVTASVQGVSNRDEEAVTSGNILNQDEITNHIINFIKGIRVETALTREALQDGNNSRRLDN